MPIFPLARGAASAPSCRPRCSGASASGVRACRRVPTPGRAETVSGGAPSHRRTPDRRSAVLPCTCASCLASHSTAGPRSPGRTVSWAPPAAFATAGCSGRTIAPPGRRAPPSCSSRRWRRSRSCHRARSGSRNSSGSPLGVAHLQHGGTVELAQFVQSAARGPAAQAQTFGLLARVAALVIQHPMPGTARRRRSPCCASPVLLRPFQRLRQRGRRPGPF